MNGKPWMSIAFCGIELPDGFSPMRGKGSTNGEPGEAERLGTITVTQGCWTP